MNIPVNYVAVFLAALSNMVIGSLWYGPLFGKQWIKLSGVKMGAGNMAMSYITAFIAALVVAYVMAHFVWLTSKGMGTDLTVASAVTTGFWAWLGFVAPATSGMVSWEGKSWTYWFIISGYWLVSLAAMGAILGMMAPK